MSSARRYSNLLRDLTSRIAVALVVLLISGLLAATLVRMAPGFGMDERMLDVRLGSSSLQAIERQGAEHSNILRYYGQYLQTVVARRFRKFTFHRPAGEGTALRTPRAESSVGRNGTGAGLDRGADDRDRAGVVAPERQ